MCCRSSAFLPDGLFELPSGTTPAPARLAAEGRADSGVSPLLRGDELSNEREGTGVRIIVDDMMRAGIASPGLAMMAVLCRIPDGRRLAVDYSYSRLGTKKAGYPLIGRRCRLERF